MSNNEDAEPEGIRALNYEVFKDYQDPRNRYFYRFDIAIVQLHSNDLEDKLEPLTIEWSYKSWEDPEKKICWAGYPQRSRDNNTRRYILEKSHQPISKQSEFIFYKDSDAGCDGSPLLRLSEQKGSGVNPRQGSRLTTVGLHNGLLGKDSYGLSFNTFESTQEMIFQLVELMGINGLMPEGLYEPSNKKTRQ